MSSHDDAQLFWPQPHGVVDRVRGVLCGLAAGDRNGGPTRMACVLAESLLDANAFDISRVAASYLRWYARDGFDTGPIAKEAFTRMLRETRRSGDGDLHVDAAMLTPELLLVISAAIDRRLNGMTGGCNAAHRSPPLAMVHPLRSDDDIAAAAVAECRITHHSPIAAHTSAACCLLCRRLIEGMSFADALTYVATRARERGWEGPVVEVLEDAAERVREDWWEGQRLMKHGFSPEVLRAALHFVGCNDSFHGALSCSIRFAGPDNYCPVLVGALAGARWGASSIWTEDVIHRMTQRDELWVTVRSLADRMGKLWGDESEVGGES